MDGKLKTRKRKADSEALIEGTPVKKTRQRKGKCKEKEQEKTPWPEYFNDLFKAFKALNTVLAFCSSRKHIATTFPTIRSSVEGLLKQKLELSKVAELKALLPNLVTFAYTQKNAIRIHGDSQGSRRDQSPDFTMSTQLDDSEEHVLVLELADGNSKGKRANNQGPSLTLPPSLTPTAMKKLIEKRNQSFIEAADELLSRTPDTEDAVASLQSAAAAYVPIHPVSVVPFAEAPGLGIMPIPSHTERASIESIITEIKEQAWYENQIADERVFEAKGGDTTASLDSPLSPTITEALQSARGINALYTHQVSAINFLGQGKNVIVSTSTASGKSVIYQVPFLRFLEDDPDATAIFIYPTKALAQDQRAALSNLLFACPGLQHVKVATYDGDTPNDERAGIRETASLIFTNFDMIHTSILPHENLWRRFFQHVQLIAVDELHYYSGIFGSHVAQIIRRFRRICAAVGNPDPRFVSCSATISKPKEHMENIFGIKDVMEVVQDGAPSGRKTFLVWNTQPPEPRLKWPNSISQATGLMRFLMKRGIRVILFCKIRKTCEMAMKIIRTELLAEGREDILKKTMPYRGGYSQDDRRHIEHEAFSGNLLGIVATNALELGVDIGVLDAVLMLGFPTSIASFRQQAGRAGRRARDSLAVLIADGSPLDQHYAAHPDELFESLADDLIVDLDSRPILEAHLQCAAFEIPLAAEDESYFGPSTNQILQSKLVTNGDGWYHPHNKFLPFPSKFISIRGVQEEKYTVVDTGTAKYSIIEEIEISRALFEIYEGGVFIHQGLTYIVKEVSHDSKLAKIVRADVNWITTPRDFTNVDAVETHRIRAINDSPHRAYYGHIEVETNVFGFFKTRNNVILDTVDLSTPAWHRDTTGFWIDVPKSTLDFLRSKDMNPAEAIHSAQHALMNRFSLAARGDLKTECKAAEKEYMEEASSRRRPARLIFYDSPGTSGGIAAKAFDSVSDLLSQALSTIESCECDQGCAKCCQSPACRENNSVHSKPGAQIILAGILAQADETVVDKYSILPEANDSIVEAIPVRVAENTIVES